MQKEQFSNSIDCVYFDQGVGYGIGAGTLQTN